MHGIIFCHFPCFPVPMGTLLLFLFVLQSNIPVNNCSVILGWSHHFLAIDQSYGENVSLKGAHLIPPRERFITWDLLVEILVGVA